MLPADEWWGRIVAPGAEPVGGAGRLARAPEVTLPVMGDANWSPPAHDARARCKRPERQVDRNPVPIYPRAAEKICFRRADVGIGTQVALLPGVSGRQAPGCSWECPGRTDRKGNPP